MSDNERYFVQKLLAVESEGLPVKDRARIFKAFKDDKINFNNLQSCLDKINTMRHPY
tara:strand:- start:481 stop:651 length:171 start_codon:yes stop_codon:yes gene_type:complete